MHQVIRDIIQAHDAQCFMSGHHGDNRRESGDPRVAFGRHTVTRPNARDRDVG